MTNNLQHIPIPKAAATPRLSVIIRLCVLGALLAGFTLSAAAPVSAPVNVTKFGHIIVLENGRKKPLDTYARNLLLQFSGKRKLSGKSALEWLTDAILYPSRAAFDKVFLVNNPDIIQTLGIPVERKRRYSFAALSQAAEKLESYHAKAIKTAQEQQTPFDREIVRIYSNLIEYHSISSTLSCLFPNPDLLIPQTPEGTIPARLADPVKPPSFLDMMRESGFLSATMLRVQQLPSDSITESDQFIIAATKKMFDLSTRAGNPPPHLLPGVDSTGEAWLSLWGYLGKYRSASLANPCVTALLGASESYERGDQTAFDKAIEQFTLHAREQAPDRAYPNPAIELCYNKLNFFLYAKMLLGFAALFALVALFSEKRMVSFTSASMSIIALLLCTAGIIMRMFIMHHPPVTNLYETFIFVAWSTIIIGLVIELMGIRPIGLITASLAGFIFLHVAGRYAAEGDTLGMLAAILDSGFWLTTHIITIALGYAGCMGAGFIGHIYLVRRMISPANQNALVSIGRAVYGVAAFGLLFTTIGTVTGGMWADQAWGRFWGWDPKENGALLIILWCAILFHARLARRIADTGMAAGSIIAAMLVMCTWIGVNLLGTGLHSYGFTSSGATMLAFYCGFELLFLMVTGGMLLLQKKRNITSPAPVRSNAPRAPKRQTQR